MVAALSGALSLNASGQRAVWVSASGVHELQSFFESAAATNKPLLLYWGATWCPPCNQLKATLFNRQDFAALTKSFIAVHIDGDKPGAQVLGQRFKVSGYPTLVLFRPDGQELMRLPGEAEPEQVMELLRQGLAGGRPVAAVLSDARAGKPLSPAEWRMLAFYSWETDDTQLLADTPGAALLAELAPAAVAASAPPDVVARLWLHALAASDEGKGVKADEPLRQRVRQLLSDPAQVRGLADVLVNRAAAIVGALGDTPEQRQTFVAQFEPALRRLEADATLSRGDRVSALISRIDLARIESPRRDTQPGLPEALQREARAHAAQADREITDPYERQAVLPSAAYALERAGLWAESEALLKANLTRSHSPYYLMSQLGSLNRKLGRADVALGWYAQSFDKAQGPATRLQWGAGYLQALVDLAPTDAARIESTALGLLDEAARDRGAFHKRSARSMQRIGRALQTWNQDGRHAASMKRVQARLKSLCSKVEAADGGRERCRALLAANGTAAAGG